jgi:hypothetical protein
VRSNIHSIIIYFIVPALGPLISSLTLKLLTSKRLTKYFKKDFPVKKSYFDGLNKIKEDKELTKKVRLYLAIETLMGIFIIWPILMVLPAKLLVTICDGNNIKPTLLTVPPVILLFFAIMGGALGLSYFLSKTLIKIIFRIFNLRTDLDPEILSRYDLFNFSKNPKEEWSLYYSNKKFNAVELDRKFAFNFMLIYFACVAIILSLQVLLS